MTRERGMSLLAETSKILSEENSQLVERTCKKIGNTAGRWSDLVNLQCSLNITTAIMTVGTILAGFLPEKEEPK